MLTDEIDYKSGAKDGHWLQYSTDGKLLYDTEYKNGEEHGLRLRYFLWIDSSDLVVKGRTHYVNGKRHGSQTKYSDSLLKSGDHQVYKTLEANWTDGKEDGVWIHYKKDGSSKKEVWKMGEKVSD